MDLREPPNDARDSGDPFVPRTGARLIVAEANSAMRKLVTSRLLDEGYEVYEADSTDRLLEMASSSAPDILSVGGIDLVVCDFQIRGPRGIDVLDRLGAGWATPVILMTSSPDRGIISTAKRLMMPLIRKPFPLRTLIDTIALTLLTRANLRPRSRQSLASTP